MFRWIKSHPWVTAGIVAGVVLLYWLYKRMASGGGGSQTGAAALPNFVYVGGGGGGGTGGGPVAPYGGSSIGTPAAAAPGSSTAQLASSPDVSVTPGTAPAPVVSAPAAPSAASAVVNEAPRAPSSASFFSEQNLRGTGSTWMGGGFDASGNIIQYQRAQPGTPEYTLTQGGFIAPSAPSVPSGGLLPYQIYLQKNGATPVAGSSVSSGPIKYNDLPGGLFGWRNP